MNEMQRMLRLAGIDKTIQLTESEDFQSKDEIIEDDAAEEEEVEVEEGCSGPNEYAEPEPEGEEYVVIDLEDEMFEDDEEEEFEDDPDAMVDIGDAPVVDPEDAERGVNIEPDEPTDYNSGELDPVDLIQQIELLQNSGLSAHDRNYNIEALYDLPTKTLQNILVNVRGNKIGEETGEPSNTAKLIRGIGPNRTPIVSLIHPNGKTMGFWTYEYKPDQDPFNWKSQSEMSIDDLRAQYGDFDMPAVESSAPIKEEDPEIEDEFATADPDAMVDIGDAPVVDPEDAERGVNLEPEQPTSYNDADIDVMDLLQQIDHLQQSGMSSANANYDVERMAEMPIDRIVNIYKKVIGEEVSEEDENWGGEAGYQADTDPSQISFNAADLFPTGQATNAVKRVSNTAGGQSDNPLSTRDPIMVGESAQEIHARLKESLVRYKAK